MLGRSRTFRPLRTLVVVSTAALLVAAALVGPAAATVARQAGAFKPVTIEHRYGSTEVEQRPERIVSLDPQWTDVLLAMGVTPVGYVRSALTEKDFPWQGKKLADSTPIPYVASIPMEQVAALQPDLILGTYAITDENMYGQLDAIAPTIGSLTDNEVESWQDLTTATGKFLGQQAKAKKVTAGVEKKIDALAAKLPGLEGKSIAFANYVPGSELVVLGDPEDGANALFAELGLELAPSIREQTKDATGRVSVSTERVDLLDGDVLAILTNGLDVEKIPGWSSLPAVQNDAVLIMDLDSATALNTPSPLSIPYGLRAIRPALEHAAAS